MGAAGAVLLILGLAALKLAALLNLHCAMENMMKRTSRMQAGSANGITAGYEAELWRMAGVLRGSMDHERACSTVDGFHGLRGGKGSIFCIKRQSCDNKVRMRAVFLFLLGCICFAGKGIAQEVYDDAKLKATKTFRCSFPVSASADMSGDAPKIKTGAEEMDVIFDQIDLKNGSARLIGNIGASDLVAINGINRISLLEVTETGNVQVVVIYGVKDSNGLFKAVYSRHTAWEGRRLIPSQSYGSCLPLFP